MPESAAAPSGPPWSLGQAALPEVGKANQGHECPLTESWGAGDAQKTITRRPITDPSRSRSRASLTDSIGSSSITAGTTAPRSTAASAARASSRPADRDPITVSPSRTQPSRVHRVLRSRVIAATHHSPTARQRRSSGLEAVRRAGCFQCDINTLAGPLTDAPDLRRLYCELVAEPLSQCSVVGVDVDRGHPRAPMC